MPAKSPASAARPRRRHGRRAARTRPSHTRRRRATRRTTRPESHALALVSSAPHTPPTCRSFSRLPASRPSPMNSSAAGRLTAAPAGRSSSEQGPGTAPPRSRTRWARENRAGQDIPADKLRRGQRRGVQPGQQRRAAVLSTSMPENRDKGQAEHCDAGRKRPDGKRPPRGYSPAACSAEAALRAGTRARTPN